MVTVGSQSALDYLGKNFIEQKSWVIVEGPTYLGALQAFSQYGVQYEMVESDGEGILPESLVQAIQRHQLIKFIYGVPTNSNPTGKTMSNERRQAIAKILKRYEVPFIEDDPYGELVYDPGEKTLPLQSFAPDWVIGLKTFSKIFAPGLRLGYMILPPGVRKQFELSQQSAILNPPTVNQAIAAVYLSEGGYAAQLPKTIELYKKRRDTMLEANEHFMPEGVTWTHPRGGMFLFYTMPERVKSAGVLRRAIEKKVACVPGAPFYPIGGAGENTFRANFSNQPPDRIELGVERLAESMKEEMG